MDLVADLAFPFPMRVIGAIMGLPDEDHGALDVTRDFNNLPRVATWGGGAHLCLGRNLALQEFAVILETLLTRCPNLTVDDAEFRPTPLMRGLSRLDVSW